MSEGVELIGRISPYLRHCGDSVRPAWVSETRCLTDYLLVYVDSGAGKFDIADGRWNSQPHDLFWIPPNTPHRMEGFGPKMHCIYAHFDIIYRYPTSHYDFTIPGGMTDLSELAPLMHPPVEDGRINALSGVIRSYNNRRVGDMLRNLVRMATHGRPYSQLSISGMLIEIIAEILAGRQNSATGGGHTLEIEKAADMAAANCSKPITVDDMIAVTELSPSQFRKLFRQHYDCSPAEYLRKSRIDKACDYMRSTNMNISQIASAVGYSDIYAFSKAFKKNCSVNPTQYRHFGSPVVRNEIRKPKYSF